MGRYVITTGQNLYDVALHLTGSIEGVVDLLICNPALSFEDTLQSGDELIYTDNFVINADVVAYFRQNGITPAGGERHVYPKSPSGPLRLRFSLDAGQLSTAFAVSGRGTLEVDWGDNSALESLVLETEVRVFNHRFDNTIAQARQVRLYGNMELESLDLSLSGTRRVRLPQPLGCERFTLRSGTLDTDFILLLSGVFRIDLRSTALGSLLPLVECREVMTVDLTDAEVSRSAVDEYLIALVKEYYGRRNCELRLPVVPSGNYTEPGRDSHGNYVLNTGLEAVWLLTHEESWNEGGHWVIHAGENTYEYKSRHSGGTI